MVKKGENKEYLGEVLRVRSLLGTYKHKDPLKLTYKFKPKYDTSNISFSPLGRYYEVEVEVPSKRFLFGSSKATYNEVELLKKHKQLIDSGYVCETLLYPELQQYVRNGELINGKHLLEDFFLGKTELESFFSSANSNKSNEEDSTEVKGLNIEEIF